MKKYEVNLSIDFGTKHGIDNFKDEWRYKTVEANTEQDAINQVVKYFEDKELTVNYVLSCTEV